MKLQKIMVDAGFTCPNRDGRVGWGGCSFCRTDSFNPSYCQGSITEQIEKGKLFFDGKYPEMKYLAYFQAYTGTYAPVDILRSRYEEALRVSDVVGLVIATRPDCLSEDVMEYLQELSHRTSITIELGVETFHDRTLLRIGRGHDAQTSVDAIRRIHAAGLPLTVHLIFGLPGETEEDILEEAELLNQLPVEAVKIHQLQILQGTRMLDDWRQHPADFISMDLQCYAELVASFIHRLRNDIHIERFASSAPPELLVAPRWGVKPYVVEQRIKSLL